MAQEAPPEAGAPAQDGMEILTSAIKDIAKFIAAQTEQGNPNASALQEWLRSGLELLSGKQGSKEEEMPEEEAQGEEEMPAEDGAVRDMNAGGGKSAVRVM
jgi:hypothetical protein